MPFTYGISSIFPSIGEIIGSALIISIIIMAIKILIAVLIIRAICKYLAKKNAEEFKYDYLATKIAEETCKRLMIIEKNKKDKNEKKTGGISPLNPPINDGDDPGALPG